MIINNSFIVVLGRKSSGHHHEGHREKSMYGLRHNLARLWNDESGISSVEYALLLAFVAAGIITAAELLSNAVQNEMSETASCIENGTGC